MRLLSSCGPVLSRSFREGLRRSPKAGLAVPILGIVVMGAIGSGLAASNRALLDVWGLGPGDRVEIDGTPVSLRLPAATFVGDPIALNAPGSREVSVGDHTVVVRREGCLPRTFGVTLTGALRKTVVLAPTSSACALPEAPPRQNP